MEEEQPPFDEELEELIPTQKQKPKKSVEEDETEEEEIRGVLLDDDEPVQLDLTPRPIDPAKITDPERLETGIYIGPKSLTRFERSRIIGARALQISMGAPVLISIKDKHVDLFELAEKELKLGLLPMTVRRSLPTGEYQDIPLSRLLKYTRLD